MPRRRRSGGTLALALDRVGGELLRDQQVDEVLRHGLRAGGIALALQILGEALVIGGAHRLGQEHPLELGEELCALAIRADVTLLAGDAERLKVGSLRHFKQEVRTVRKGSECGMILADWSDLAPGDAITLYEVVSRRPKLWDTGEGGGGRGNQT